MKTKKILAILTLVAFMISILPMAAFANAIDINKTAVSVEESTAKAEGLVSGVVEDLDDEHLEYEVLLRGTDWLAASGYIYVATSRPSADKIYVNDIYVPQTSSAAAVYDTSGDVAKVVVKIFSDVPGTTKIAFGTDVTGAAREDLADFVQGKTNTSSITAGAFADAENNYIQTGTFTSAAVKKTGLTATITTSGDGAKLANGTAYHEVEAYLEATNGAPVVGKEITFSTNKSAARLSATKATTDAAGKAKVKVYSEKPGDYTVTVKADGADDFTTSTFSFRASGIYSIKAESDNNQKIALKEEATFKFSFADSNGNKYSVTAPTTITKGEVKDSGHELQGAQFAVITKPSGAALDLEKNDNYTLSIDDGNLKLKIAKDKLNKEGDYSIKMTLANGKSVTYDFKVKEQGTITSMTLKYKSNSLPATENVYTPVPEVKLVDAEGYAVDADLSKVVFSVDNTSVLTVNNTGAAGAYTAGSGSLTVVETNKTGAVTVTAVHDDKKIVATTVIDVVKPASYIKLTPASYYPIENGADIDVQLTDIDGKQVVAEGTVDVSSSKITVLSKPEGAIVSTDFDSSFKTDMEQKGKSSITVDSNVAGTVKVQVTVKSGDKYYTGSADVNFGEQASGLKPLTMFIGAATYMVDGAPAITDAAPFIENGRTFVAVRPIGDALGATINWDAATQTVTLTKPGETVTIVIGASTIKVDKAGVVTEWPTDAPAKIKDGRTYLPFRAIGEAMGYTVSWDAATQTVSFK